MAGDVGCLQAVPKPQRLHAPFGRPVQRQLTRYWSAGGASVLAVPPDAGEAAGERRVAGAVVDRDVVGDDLVPPQKTIRLAATASRSAGVEPRRPARHGWWCWRELLDVLADRGPTSHTIDLPDVVPEGPLSALRYLPEPSGTAPA
ncbi:hypothetical protein GCM10010129_73350 [Streptomyces fumigatiscleroticus]|nr:hypothetical protein GCM10010129_73350 [Streptomyces fumigatiscleroticus]